MKTKMFRASLAFCLTVGASVASAGSVTWTLQNVAFDSLGGGTMSGTFSYDADTNAYSSFALTTSDGYSYAYLRTAYSASATGVSAVSSNAANLSGAHDIFLGFQSALTDAGGTVSVTTSVRGVCLALDTVCGSAQAGGVGHSGTVTTLTGTVPEPATWVGFGSGMLCALVLGWRRRKCEG